MQRTVRIARLDEPAGQTRNASDVSGKRNRYCDWPEVKTQESAARDSKGASRVWGVRHRRCVTAGASSAVERGSPSPG